MNQFGIKTRPLLTAVGLGVAIQLVYTVISNGISVAPMLADNYDPTEMSPMTMAVGLLACICVPLIVGGAGFFYAYLHAREGGITLQEGALGGAATGVLIQLVGGVIGACLSLLIVPLVLQSTMANVPPEVANAAAVGGVIGGIVGAVIGICIGTALGAGLGAAGGAIGGAVFKGSGQTSAPTMPSA